MFKVMISLLLHIVITQESPELFTTPTTAQSSNFSEVDWLGPNFQALKLNCTGSYTELNTLTILFLASHSIANRISFPYIHRNFIDNLPGQISWLQNDPILPGMYASIQEDNYLKWNDSSAIIEDSPSYVRLMKNEANDIFTDVETTNEDSSVLELLQDELLPFHEVLMLLEGTKLCTRFVQNVFRKNVNTCEKEQVVNGFRTGYGQSEMIEALKRGPVISFVYSDLRNHWLPKGLREEVVDADEEKDEGIHFENLFNSRGKEEDRGDMGYEEEDESMGWIWDDFEDAELVDEMIDEAKEKTEEILKIPVLVYRLTQMDGKWYFYGIVKQYFETHDYSLYRPDWFELLCGEEGGVEVKQVGECGLGEEFYVPEFI